MLVRIREDGVVESVVNKDQLDGTGEVYWVGTDKPNHDFIYALGKGHFPAKLAEWLRDEYEQLPPDYDAALRWVQDMLLFSPKPDTPAQCKKEVTRLVMEGFIHMAFLRGGQKVLTAARGNGDETPEGKKSWVPTVLASLLTEWADAQRYQGWGNGGAHKHGRCETHECLSHNHYGSYNDHEALFWTKVDREAGVWRCHYCGSTYPMSSAGLRGWERIPDPHEPGTTHCIPGRDY
jgi:hypothetical protein